jgi:hypothetical protein
MKILINQNQYKKILKESLSDIAYHFTHKMNLVNILENDEIMFSSALGSTADLQINRGKYNFLSTTRSRRTGYKRGSVKLVLDGRKLNQKYKSIPVDYWQYGPSGAEQEDRIISDDVSIPNFTKYIIEIHVWAYSNEKLKKLKKLADKYNIPIYFYKTENDFLNQTNDVDLSTMDIDDFEEEANDFFEKSFDYTLASFIAYNNPSGHQKIIEYLQDENKIYSFEQIMSVKILEYFKPGAIYFGDGLRTISSIIHESRSRPNKNSKFLLTLLIKDMRKHKAKNIKEYLIKKQYIGKKTFEDIKKELLQKVFSKALIQLDDEMEYRLNTWIEINGTYYNYAYESPEIKKYLMDYISNVRKYIADAIKNEKDLVYVYGLGFDDIRKNVKPNNIEDSFQITDKNDYLDLDKKIEDTLYNVTSVIASEYRDKSFESMEQYKNQFNN